MDKVAEIIQVLPIGCVVVSFYTMYNRNQSVYLFEFCQTSPVASTERRQWITLVKLGVQLGEITADGLLK
jgi:hypothetical protein